MEWFVKRCKKQNKNTQKNRVIYKCNKSSLECMFEVKIQISEGGLLMPHYDLQRIGSLPASISVYFKYANKFFL